MLVTAAVREIVKLLSKVKADKGLSSVSIRTLFTVLNYITSNDPVYVRFEINFLL